MNQRGKWTLAELSRECGYRKEEIKHDLKCRKAYHIWDKLSQIIEKWGRRNRAAPHLLTNILHRISNIRKGKNWVLQHHFPVLSEAYSPQAWMGWFQEFLGLISKKWSDIQQLYIQSLGSKVMGLMWISYLIRKLVTQHGTHRTAVTTPYTNLRVRSRCISWTR